MAIKPYLDRVGLTNLWANIKAYVTSRVPTKVSELTNDSGYITGVSWDNVSGKPSTFTPSSHTHDDRYYTESEINTKLGIKANDANVVHLTGDESITNKKTFSNDIKFKSITLNGYTI